MQDLNDEEGFFEAQKAINDGLAEVRAKMEVPSGVKVCVECGEDIGEARIKAVPYTTLCIDCAKLKDR